MTGFEIMLTILIMIVCLMLEGLFSGSEIAVVSANKLKLRHQAAKGSRGAKLALKMLEKPEWLLSTTLVGTNIAVVTNTTLATGLMIALFGDSGSWLAIILVAPLIWVFGEIVPKSVFQQRADVVTPRVIFFLDICSRLFSPILFIFSKVTKIITWMLGGDKNTNPFTLREEINAILLMPGEGGDIAQQEKTMIRRVFDFTETSAQEIMIPLIHVVAIEKSEICRRAKSLAMEKSHIRFPVYDQRVDQIVGMLNVLKIIREDPEKPIAAFIEPVTFVPGTISIHNLLLALQKASSKLAVVVDEYGGSNGIVTIEDIMEEVVEEFEDEYDNQAKGTPLVRKLNDNEFVVNARIEWDNLLETLGLDLPKGNYTTLAGFLLAEAREIPVVGAVIKSNDFEFTVVRGTTRVIHEVKIKW